MLKEESSRWKTGTRSTVVMTARPWVRGRTRTGRPRKTLKRGDGAKEGAVESWRTVLSRYLRIEAKFWPIQMPSVGLKPRGVTVLREEVSTMWPVPVMRRSPEEEARSGGVVRVESIRVRVPTAPSSVMGRKPGNSE